MHYKLSKEPIIDDLKAEITRLKKELKKKKKYGLVWEEKPEDVVELCKEKLPVLKEVTDKEIITDENKPTNILIEGDNYHALSVLNYTHAGKIDVIYIDPPYNIGNKDFKYNDSYVDKEDGYRHSKWLSFMSERLTLSKKLLKSTGVLFISIDDNEIAQLKMLCDGIFTETKYVGIFIRKTKSITSDVKTGLNVQHEYCLIYASNKEKFKLTGFEKTFNSYFNPDNDLRGDWTSSDPTAMDDGRKNKNIEPIINPYTGKVDLPGNGRRWRFNLEGFKLLLGEGRIIFKKQHKKNERGFILKRYKNEVMSEYNLANSLMIDNIYLNQAATKELALILGEKKIDFPKPITFIKDLIQFSTLNNREAIVLDFFAGSGTTGHAILELNKEDGGNRKFILCTNNENNICTDVCYQRIKKVIKGYKNLKGENIKGLGGNLKYFKTEFVDAKPTDKNKKKLTDEATEMLCLREDTFEKVKTKNKTYKIFKNQKRYTGIIFDPLAIDDFKESIKNIDAKFNVYVFSLGDDAYDEEFEDMKTKVKVQPIPEAILRVYRRIFR